MTPDQALFILDKATDPRNAGQHNRMDYANMEAALLCLREALKPKGSADAPAPQ